MKSSGEAERSRDRLLRQPTVQAGALFPLQNFYLVVLCSTSEGIQPNFMKTKLLPKTE